MRRAWLGVPVGELEEPRGTHQAEQMGTELFLIDFVPPENQVHRCPAAQHARWRGESKCRWE